MFHNNLTNRVKKHLMDIGVSNGRLNELFIALTQPSKKSLIFIEQEELLKIASKIENNKEALSLFKNNEAIKEKLPKNIYRLIDKHHKKYYYTKHLWVEGEYTINDYLNQLRDILCSGVSAESILKKMNDELRNNKIQKKKTYKELNIDDRWQSIFNAFGGFMVTKIYRRYAQILAMHHMSAILKEIAKRNFITEKQVRFMMPREIKELLLNNVLRAEELLSRNKLCVYYAEKDFDIVYAKDQANEILKDVEKIINTDIAELKGDIGCPGQARGRVKIIIRAEDMVKMEEGDILVSIATDPDIVPAMKKAAAIVTEQGGVTSHAAIVSRELNIPCVIGTKIATRVLKDGDMVEVDANTGIIRIIN
ncbi:hypothetical protein KKA13_04560 [Patescibacteria group bacterium]|nr:hypothetical protein [Patescibacteria group bacterium]